jgi:hypothetical protein
MKLKEKRKGKRFCYTESEKVFVELRMCESQGASGVFDLTVNDCSETGLGIIVTEKEMDMLDALAEGRSLLDITFFSSWKVFRINGTVRHKTRISEGNHSGSYLLGIESSHAIRNCWPFNP